MGHKQQTKQCLNHKAAKLRAEKKQRKRKVRIKSGGKPVSHVKREPAVSGHGLADLLRMREGGLNEPPNTQYRIPPP